MKRLLLLVVGTALGASSGCGTTHPSAQPDGVAAARATIVMPFLMFQDGRSEEAVNRYVEVFAPNAKVIFIKRYGKNGVGAKEGSIEHAVFKIHGQRIGVTESPAKHPFEFTPSVSLFVDFPSEQEHDRVFAALSAGGEVMMPPGDYGFSKKFAFIQDRYGVSWQLNVPSKK